MILNIGTLLCWRLPENGQGLCSIFILVNNICLLCRDFVDLKVNTFWLAKGYGVANQKVCYF